MQEFQRVLSLDSTLLEVHYNTGRLYADQARDVTGTGVEELQRKVTLLQQAQAAFTRFRDALGGQYAAHPRREDVEGQLSRLPQALERANRALQRAQVNARRTAATPAAATPAAATPAAATPAAATPAAATPAPATPEGATGATPGAAGGATQ
jgi:cell division septation protein DedD